MTSDSLTFLRNNLFGLLGLLLISYAVLVLITGRPDPMHPAIPGIVGVAVGALTWITASIAGPKAADVTWDELTLSEWRKATSAAYYVAIWLYPLFAIFLYNGQLESAQAFAAMGTLTAAAPFLFFVLSWLKGRV